MRRSDISVVTAVIQAIAPSVRVGLDVRALSILSLRYLCSCDHIKPSNFGRMLTFAPIMIDAESLQIHYDPAKLSYTTLLQFFYRMHDPTTPNRQGMDTGTQYRSAIFYHSPEQKAEAEEVTTKVNEQWYKGKVATELLEAGKWWDAEEYHQLYLDRNPGGYECPAHYVRSFPDLK